MKKNIKFILKKISIFIYYIVRIIDLIIPAQLKKDFKSKSKLELKLEDNLAEETFNHFKKDIKKSLIFKSVSEIRRYAIKTSLLNDKNKEYYYLEFGIFEGKSSNFFSKFINRLYCFDSFEGLTEDWIGTSDSKGTFKIDKKKIKLNSNIETVDGWVEDTLDNFLNKHNPKINFVHLDLDTYSSTRFVLEKIKPYLLKNSVIVFDEMYNYYGWEAGEYKALKELFKEDEFKYKAFCINNQQVVIQIK